MCDHFYLPARLVTKAQILALACVFVFTSACSPTLRSGNRTTATASVTTTNQSTISATGPTTVGSASVVTITLLNDSSEAIVGSVPTFTSSNGADTLGVCSASNGAGVSTCTLDSTVAELKTLTIATPLAATGITGTTIFTAGVAASITATGFTDPTVAGVAHNITITAYDAFGNVATGYTGTMAITSNDGAATLPANYTFVAGDAGVRAISVTLKTAGAGKTITATDTGNGALTATQNNIDVTVAAASKLSFSQQPVGGVDTDTNLATQPIVQVLDAYDNLVTTAVNPVTLTASAHATCATTIASAVSATANPFTSVAGVATFAAVKVLNVSAVRLQASAAGLTSACSNAFVVTPGTFNTTASTFTLSAATVATTATVTGTVTPKDANGNNTTVGFTGEAQITFAHAGGTSTATFSATAAPVSGAYDVTITGGTAGTATTITATINGSALVTTRALTVTGAAFGALDHFLVSMNATPTAHTSETITITAKDASNNTVTNNTSTVVFTSTDDDVTLPANLVLVAGTNNTSITLRSVGSVTVTVTSGAITGSQTVTVAAVGGVKTEFTLGRFVDQDGRFGAKWWNSWFWYSGGYDDGRKLIADVGGAVRNVSALAPNSNRYDYDPGPINFISQNYALYSAFNYTDGKYYMYWADWGNSTNIQVTNEVSANEVSYQAGTYLAFKGKDPVDSGFIKLLLLNEADTVASNTSNAALNASTAANTSACAITGAAGGIGVPPAGVCPVDDSTLNENPLNITGHTLTNNFYFTSINYYGHRRLYHMNTGTLTLTDITPIAGTTTVVQTQIDSTGRLFYITSDGTSPELYVYTPGGANLKLTHGWDAVPAIGTFAYNVDKFSYNAANNTVFFIADRSAGAVGTNKVFSVLSDGTATSEVSNILAGNEGGIDVMAELGGNVSFISNGGTGTALYKPAIDTTQYFTTASLFDYSSNLRVVQGVINGIVSLWSYDQQFIGVALAEITGFGNAEGYTSMTVYPDPAAATTISARGYKAVNDTTQAVMRSGTLAGQKRVFDSGGTKGRDKPLYPTYFNGRIYYAGLDATGAYKLFKTDGTTITQISDTRGASRSDGITAVVATSGRLYFTALASATALKLYEVTTGDVVTQVSNILVGLSDEITLLTPGTSRVFFKANSGGGRYKVFYVATGDTSATQLTEVSAGFDDDPSLLTVGASDTLYYKAYSSADLSYIVRVAQTNGTYNTINDIGSTAATALAWSGSYLYYSASRIYRITAGFTSETVRTSSIASEIKYYRGHLYFINTAGGGTKFTDINFNSTESNLVDDVQTESDGAGVFSSPLELTPIGSKVYFSAADTVSGGFSIFRWNGTTMAAMAGHTAAAVRPTLLTRVGSSLVFVNNHTADATVTGKISILNNTGTITDAVATLSPYHTDDITWIKNVNGIAYFNGNAAGTIDYTRMYQLGE